MPSKKGPEHELPAVALNLFFNGAGRRAGETVAAGAVAQAH